jgi:hypothetical protein
VIAIWDLICSGWSDTCNEGVGPLARCYMSDLKHRKCVGKQLKKHKNIL